MTNGSRRFPPPWRADKIPGGGYVVRDANGQAIAYIYSRENEAEARQAKVLTTDEARRINIARLQSCSERATVRIEFPCRQSASSQVLDVGTTAGREIRGSHSALNPCPRLVPATTRSQRRSVTSAGLWNSVDDLAAELERALDPASISLPNLWESHSCPPLSASSAWRSILLASSFCSATACLTRLHQLRGLGDAKVLKSLGHSPKGRHYRG
jgi:hypothetical protein